MRKGPLPPNLSSLPSSIMQALATSDSGEGGSELSAPSGETGRGSGPSAWPLTRRRSPSTVKQKLTPAAPTSGAWLRGGARGARQQLSGTDGLEGGEDRSQQLPRPPIPFPIKQKRIQQHRPQRGERAVNAGQCTWLLRAPRGPGFPMVVLAAAVAAVAAAAEAAAAPAAPASRAFLGLSTWRDEQLRASFR